MTTDEMKAAIEESLRKFWASQSLEIDKTSETMGDLIDPLDSLSAIDALLDIEAIVGMKVPERKVIRPGGYESQAHFVDHLTTRILQYVGSKAK